MATRAPTSSTASSGRRRVSCSSPHWDRAGVGAICSAGSPRQRQERPGARACARSGRPPRGGELLRVSPDRRTWFITGADPNAQAAATWPSMPPTGRTRWVARGPLGATASPVRVSSDDRLVAVGYSQGTTDVLDAKTGRLVVRNASSAGIGAGDMAFGPGDRSLVTVALDGVDPAPGRRTAASSCAPSTPPAIPPLTSRRMAEASFSSARTERSSIGTPAASCAGLRACRRGAPSLRARRRALRRHPSCGG